MRPVAGYFFAPWRPHVPLGTPSGGGWALLGESLLLHRNNLINPPGQLRQISLVAAAQLRRQEPIVLDFLQRPADLQPAHVALKEILPLVALALEVLQMNLD